MTSPSDGRPTGSYGCSTAGPWTSNGRREEMYARLPQLEIDTLRIDVGAAVDMFKREVLPELQTLPGYAGLLVLTTPTGQAALLSLWTTPEAADADSLSGFYA